MTASPPNPPPDCGGPHYALGDLAHHPTRRCPRCPAEAAPPPPPDAALPVEVEEALDAINGWSHLDLQPVRTFLRTHIAALTAERDALRVNLESVMKFSEKMRGNGLRDRVEALEWVKEHYDSDRIAFRDTVDDEIARLEALEEAERWGASSTGGSLKLNALAPVTFAPKYVPLKLAGKIPDLPPAPDPWSVEALGYDAYAALAAIPRTVEFSPRTGEVVAVKDWLAEHVAQLTHLAGIKLQEEA